MSRHRYIWHNGEIVELDLNAPRPPRKGPYIMRDQGEYRSVITGEMITSRSQHREHLRQHNCIEVGNEMPQRAAPATLPPLREDLRQAMQASPERHAEAAAVARAAADAGPIEGILP